MFNHIAETPAKDSAKPIGRERHNSRVIGREHDPRYYECVPVMPQYERGDLP